MKIRTITTGINLKFPIAAELIARSAEFDRRARRIFEDHGYAVQTLRIASQPWPSYLGHLGPKKLVTTIRDIEMACADQDVDFFSIGTTLEPRHTSMIPRVIEATSRISASAAITDKRRTVTPAAIQAASEAIVTIAKLTKRGYGNFRFAAIANCPPNTPFFPAAYHQGSRCFSIGLEAGDLVFKAFRSSCGLADARRKLARLLQAEYGRVEALALRIEKRERIHYAGLDASPAPALKRNASIAFAFEKLGMGRFGGQGSLIIARLVTDVLKSLKIRHCGYSGLMLPVLEDAGLVQAVARGALKIDDLLSLSAVCGTGLDCIPLPGSTPPDTIAAILRDIAALAVGLNKPLSARLLLAPGKRSGQMTAFRSPFLIDCPVMKAE